MQVEYNGLISTAAQVPVMTAIPGIITTNSQGTGQAVAVNQDGTLNSAGNPAAGASLTVGGVGAAPAYAASAPGFVGLMRKR